MKGKKGAGRRLCPALRCKRTITRTRWGLYVWARVEEGGLVSRAGEKGAGSNVRSWEVVFVVVSSPVEVPGAAIVVGGCPSSKEGGVR